MRLHFAGIYFVAAVAVVTTSVVTANADVECRSTGQGKACFQGNPDFNWQPPVSAPRGFPIYAGNATALWLRSQMVGNCDDWYPPIEAFLLARVEQNLFLSSVIPSCGFEILPAIPEFRMPGAGNVTTLTHITTSFQSLTIAVTPLVHVSDGNIMLQRLQNPEFSQTVLKHLVDICITNQYDGLVLDFDFHHASVSPFNVSVLHQFMKSLMDRLGERKSVGFTVSSLEQSDAFADAIRGTGVIVHITQTAHLAPLTDFTAALSQAADVFSTQNTSIALGLSTKFWWGGTGKPSITDANNRLGALQTHNFAQMSLDVEWADEAYVENQAMLDLIQLPIMAPFRGGDGFDWETFFPPIDGSIQTRATWGDAVQSWRTQTREKLGFTKANLPYDNPELSWTRSNFVSPQVMLHDRFLYNRTSGVWTVDKFLADLTARYGGVDSVLLWHSYPNIGVDDRSQFDMLRSLPGGLDALKDLVDDFHRANVKVLLPYNPWDTGTNRSGKSDVFNMVDAMHAVGAEGFNGDTMFGINASFYDESLLNGGRAIATQPELGADQRLVIFANGTRKLSSNTGNTIAMNTMTWNYWGYMGPGVYPCSNCSGGVLNVSDPAQSNIAGIGPPYVSRYRVLDSRHMAQICERWAIVRTDGLQHVFINGGGYAPWENVWGIWNPLSDRDAAALQRTMHVLKYFQSFVMGATFEPHVAIVRDHDQHLGVFCSMFGGVLFTCISRGTQPLPEESVTLNIPCDLVASGSSIWNVWEGKGTIASPCNATTNVITVTVALQPRSYTSLAILTQAESTSDAFQTFCKVRQTFAKSPLHNLSAETQPLQQERVADQTPSGALDPTNTTKLSATSYTFKVHGVQVEGFGGLQGPDTRSQPDVQFSWEPQPQRFHQHNLSVAEYLIDLFPVTNARFKQFLETNAWRPQTSQNFLSHWRSTAMASDARSKANVSMSQQVDTFKLTPMDGTEEQPVRWVSRTDAAAFCASEGKRLPTSVEWQLAAQSTDLRSYPWGNTWDDSAVPPRVTGTTMHEPSDVGSHPTGAAASGVQDMVGVIWQWCDSYCDDHTCRSIVRGGNWYAPVGTAWYFPAALRLDEQNTMLELSDSMDRSAGIGFRCAADDVSVAL
eukprot:m.41977 g.41977  ORF g.41977 m.41977 type:complete len:1120 (-) comp18968_c0_seq2:244-3603(-)